MAGSKMLLESEPAAHGKVTVRESGSGNHTFTSIPLSCTNEAAASSVRRSTQWLDLFL